MSEILYKRAGRPDGEADTVVVEPSGPGDSLSSSAEHRTGARRHSIRPSTRSERIGFFLVDDRTLAYIGRSGPARWTDHRIEPVRVRAVGGGSRGAHRHRVRLGL
jgi:hypothetical protein